MNASRLLKPATELEVRLFTIVAMASIIAVVTKLFCGFGMWDDEVVGMTLKSCCVVAEVEKIAQ